MALNQTDTEASAIAALCVATSIVQKLHLKGLLTSNDVNELFEAALIALERAPEDATMRLARALVDAQAQLILTGRQPTPPTQEGQ